MIPDTGVFAVARTIWDHPCLDDGKPYTKREAWIWLIGVAGWKAHRIGTPAGIINLERGEFCYSVRFLSDKWRWSKSRVDRFLDMLEKQDMIRDTSRDSTKVYLISKYNDYQVVGLPQRDNSGTASGTAAGQQRDSSGTKKKKGNKGRREDSIPLAKANGQHAADFLLFEAPPIDQAKTELGRDQPQPQPQPPKPVDPWKTVYDRGKQVLGRESGGIITKLKLLYDGKPHKVLAKIEDAAEQREPLTWITAFLWKVDDGGKLSGEYIGGVPP